MELVLTLPIVQYRQIRAKLTPHELVTSKWLHDIQEILRPIKHYNIDVTRFYFVVERLVRCYGRYINDRPLSEFIDDVYPVIHPFSLLGMLYIRNLTSDIDETVNYIVKVLLDTCKMNA